MLALILALSLFLHIADPINDGYGNSSLTPPSSIYYRSVNAIDISDFSLTNDSKLGFKISFSDLSNPNDLKNGFSLPIVEVYFDDGYKAAKSANLLPGSGMRLGDGENWHYAFKLSGDFIKLFENTDSGIIDISKEHQIDISTEGNSIVVSSDLAKKRNLKAYVIAGNYSAFSRTGWKEISKKPGPWSYSSTSQTRPVVDLVAENTEIQKQAINSGIVPVVSSRVSSLRLWRNIMLLGLLLGLIGLIANLLADKKQPRVAETAKLADRARAATQITELDQVDNFEEDNEFFDKLDIDISEYEKSMIIEKPLDSDLDIDLDLEQFEDAKQVNEENSAPLSDEEAKAEKEIFTEQDRPGQASKIKKNKKINVHNFSEESELVAEKEAELVDESSSLPVDESKVVRKNEAKKSLRVVDTVSTETKSTVNQDFEQNLPESNVDNEEEISFSLGDSFWDDFDKTRNIWKK